MGLVVGSKRRVDYRRICERSSCPIERASGPLVGNGSRRTLKRGGGEWEGGREGGGWVGGLLGDCPSAILIRHSTAFSLTEFSSVEERSSRGEMRRWECSLSPMHSLSCRIYDASFIRNSSSLSNSSMISIRYGINSSRTRRAPEGGREEGRKGRCQEDEVSTIYLLDVPRMPAMEVILETALIFRFGSSDFNSSM